MAYKYKPQRWANYNGSLEASDQPEAIITKQRLDYMEKGIQKNSMELYASCDTDETPGAIFEEDTVNKRKVLKIHFPILKIIAATKDAFGGIKAKTRTQEDMETAIGSDGRIYTGILRSPDGSKFKLVVDNNGVLSTEKII